jgi:hypothetical protein
MVVGMAETRQRYDEPFHMKKEARSTQDTLEKPGLGGITHFKWNVCPLMDRTSPRKVGRYLECVAVCCGYWHVWQLGRALEGLTSNFWMLDMPKKGQRLPQKGLTSHLLLILCHLSSI